MTSPFQTAVRSTVHHTRRHDAIDRMIDDDERKNLSVIAQLDGLRAEYRRRALEGLATCHASAELETLADESTLEPLLRRQASELA
ncbi:hypothetical protein [Natronorubrum aibiense]|uniref:Uncharacterized protein n=1 Tax=Natronorubrum aibiense TaxID=348826 RepID=A0A5P9P3U5_9EURY|nr:hypothetical protein [Natronorubrum aibiense]QFU82736.1 hypothetical protein GCU68_09455 [Natronorubrum aibiense]